jgi:hypothetical protein
MRQTIVMMMAMTMMDWRRRKHLSQNFFLELPVDGGDTPAALLL